MCAQFRFSTTSFLDSSLGLQQKSVFFLSGYSEPFKKERDPKKDFSARHEISTCVSVHARVTISACVLEEIEGGFVINQSPSLSVRAAHTPWLND